jgi:hypothetical protein
LVPTFVPFKVHWYVGVVPPLVGVAVKVTLVPEQIVVAGVVMLTLAIEYGLTVIVNEFEVAVGVTKQGVAFEVITQVTISEVTNVAVV